jgi:hypothetical protein
MSRRINREFYFLRSTWWKSVKVNYPIDSPGNWCLSPPIDHLLYPPSSPTTKSLEVDSLQKRFSWRKRGTRLSFKSKQMKEESSQDLKEFTVEWTKIFKRLTNSFLKDTRGDRFVTFWLKTSWQGCLLLLSILESKTVTFFTREVNAMNSGSLFLSRSNDFAYETNEKIQLRLVCYGGQTDSSAL